MHRCISVFLSVAVLLAHGVRAQSVAPAPRTPVQKATPVAPPHATPVVPPHGPAHPQKPAGAHAQKPAPAPPPAVAAPAPIPEPAPAPAAPQAAEKLPDPEKPEGSAPKLPRFASLRADEVNMRAGPGTKYPIEWVYKRRELPVEIEREFDVWRYVRDADGIRGWMQQATLMGRRSFIVRPDDATMRQEASDTAAAVAVVKAGVIGRIRSCEAASDWCNVQTGSYRGYLRRSQIWGLLPNEIIAP